MASVTQSSRFLVLDLRSLGQELHGAWQQIQGWPLFAWLAPALPVRLLHANGRESLWLVDGANVRSSSANVSTARFVAVELPEDGLLFRRLSLPSLSAAEIAQAVALDVAGASPFPPEDLVWGYSTQRVASTGNLEIKIALASHRWIANYLSAAAPRLAGGAVPEVWAIAAPSSFIAFGGFGETQRKAHSKLRQRFAFALLLIALGLGACIAVSPVAQARLRAIEAVQASDALVKRAEPLIRQRAAFLRNVDTGNSLKEILTQRVDPLYVMDLLTRVLPDDTSLLGLQIQGPKVAINGSTPNAAALMQQLSAIPELREVKAPAPATRPLGSTKDSFNIEFIVVARPAPVSQVNGLAVAAPPASGLPTDGASAQPRQTASAVPAPQPAARSTAVFGETARSAKAP